jgi:hypothetical protein
VKLWNPVARVVDVVSTAQEAAAAAGTSIIERPIANLIAKRMAKDTKFSGLTLANKVEMWDRFKVEVAKNFESAKVTDVSMYGGGGPATKLAGMLDSPGRAFHFLSYAGERAQAISKTTGRSFADILDQVRNPEKPGPLSARQAMDVHEQAVQYSDINMLTNANFASRAKHAVTKIIEGSVSEPLKPILHGINDITFQFGRVLVNVADKTGQAANLPYGVLRAAYELFPNKKGADVAVRARTFSQIVRRAGIGAGMSWLGYQYYKEGGRAPEVAGVPLGSTVVRVFDKNGKKSGSVYQDDGYLSMIGGMTAAFMTGYRSAQIDAQTQLTDSQRSKMHHALNFAPIKDNPVMGNVSRYMKALDSPSGTDTFWSIMTGLYWPGGLREWREMQDKQEGVFSRRASGPLEIAKSRTPYLKDGLPVKGRKEGS